jgi:hypothetical protein
MMLHTIRADTVRPGDTLQVSDWALHVYAVLRAAGRILVRVDEFDFPLPYQAADKVKVDR